MNKFVYMMILINKLPINEAGLSPVKAITRH